MQRTGTADLPLHYGKAPRWLFEKMRRLAREISLVIIEEFGPEEFLRKLSDPYWFQSFGCVLAFDWHSSGLTTTVCGAIKDGLKELQDDLGIYVAGGKGATSRKTPSQIMETSDRIYCDPKDLVYASRMAAKVDSAAVQDGYQLYHHSFIFTKTGNWCVIQQGMNENTRFARRYHWLGENVTDFVCEPHAAVCCDQKGKTLNMVAKESQEARDIFPQIARQKPQDVASELKMLSHHDIRLSDINPDRLSKTLLATYQLKPLTFERLLGIEGVGPKTIRAMSLISELIYGVSPSFRDPARFSYSHGGKDGHPYPVNRRVYQDSIDTLGRAIRKARLGQRDRLEAIKRLGNLIA